MNRADIIRMLNEAAPNKNLVGLAELECFAALIAEDCAKRCEQLFDPDDDSCSEAETCAAAIREAYKP